MSFYMKTGVNLKCSFCLTPGVLNVLPVNKVLLDAPASMGNIMDHKPMVNITPFGMCMCPANPVVASATAAAMGVLTPMPCIPNTTTPWMPGNPTVLVGGMPALMSTDTCMCLWGGVINIVAGVSTAME